MIISAALVGLVFYVIDSKLHKEAWGNGYKQGYLDGQLNTLTKLKIVMPDKFNETKDEDETVDSKR